MGPIVLLAGVLLLLYGIAAMFAGRSVASTTRQPDRSGRYAVVVTVIGLTAAATGLVLILA